MQGTRAPNTLWPPLLGTQTTHRCSGFWVPPGARQYPADNTRPYMARADSSCRTKVLIPLTGPQTHLKTIENLWVTAQEITDYACTHIILDVGGDLPGHEPSFYCQACIQACESHKNYWVFRVVASCCGQTYIDKLIGNTVPSLYKFRNPPWLSPHMYFRSNRKKAWVWGGSFGETVFFPAFSANQWTIFTTCCFTYFLQLKRE